MARCFTKVSEEEIVAINEAAFFYPSDLVNTKTTLSPSGSVKSSGYIPVASPSGDSCIVYQTVSICQKYRVFF